MRHLIKKLLLLTLVGAVLFAPCVTPTSSALNPALSIGINASRVASFKPIDISGLVGWWDASDASTITLNGSNVSAWADKSGHNMTISQGSSTYQPEYITSAHNGKNAVRVTSTKYMDGDSTGAKSIFRNIEYVAIFTVFYPTDISMAIGRLYSFTRAFTDYESSVLYIEGKRLNSDALNYQANNNSAVNTMQMIIAQWNCNNGELSLQINNTAQSIGANKLTIGKFDDNDTVLGRVIGYSTSGALLVTFVSN